MWIDTLKVHWKTLSLQYPPNLPKLRGKKTGEMSSGDDIQLILLGLQHIYTTKSLKEAIFKIVQKVIPHKSKKDSNGMLPREGKRIGTFIVDIEEEHDEQNIK